jgi:hypothetical protein
MRKICPEGEAVSHPGGSIVFRTYEEFVLVFVENQEQKTSTPYISVRRRLLIITIYSSGDIKHFGPTPGTREKIEDNQ